MKEQLDLFPQEELQQQEAGSIDTTEIDVPEAQPIQDAEWCFQFFNNQLYLHGQMKVKNRLHWLYNYNQRKVKV